MNAPLNRSPFHEWPDLYDEIERRHREELDSPNENRPEREVETAALPALDKAEADD